jgi:transcriptional regulator with XRE-family HTH domain
VYAEDVDQTIKRDIGTRIRRRREALRLSQEELGLMSEVGGQREISRWETGQVRPSGQSLRKLAVPLQCSWRSLAYGQSYEPEDEDTPAA